MKHSQVGRYHVALYGFDADLISFGIELNTGYRIYPDRSRNVGVSECQLLAATADLHMRIIEKEIPHDTYVCKHPNGGKAVDCLILHNMEDFSQVMRMLLHDFEDSELE